jgi:large subunit ribosomal protein L10
MSKRVKALIEKEIATRFTDVENVAVINPRGIDAIKNNNIRRKLRAQGLRMVVVKNSLAKRASANSKLKGFEKLLEGPSAVIYGEAGISTLARMLLEEKKADEKIELRGIFFDGEVYEGEEGVKRVSTMPTREEAIATVVAALLSPGRKLAGAVKGPVASSAPSSRPSKTRQRKRKAHPPEGGCDLQMEVEVGGFEV